MTQLLSKKNANWLVAGAAILLGACGSVETCEEPQFYEYAETGTRIVAPDDLDNLPGYKEMTIPEASARAPRDRSEGCLDRPPTMRVSGDSDDEEEETS